MRIGQRWQPEPVLRRCAQRPVHALAVQSRAMASLRILHENRLRYICAAVPHGHAYMPDHLDPESIARTATGRVLYAAQPPGKVSLPDCWTRREWRDLRDSLADPRATVIDRQDAVPGICCISAPVWWPNGTCAGRSYRLRSCERSARRAPNPSAAHRFPHRHRPSATGADVLNASCESHGPLSGPRPKLRTAVRRWIRKVVLTGAEHS